MISVTKPSIFFPTPSERIAFRILFLFGGAPRATASARFASSASFTWCLLFLLNRGIGTSFQKYVLKCRSDFLVRLNRSCMTSEFSMAIRNNASRLDLVATRYSELSTMPAFVMRAAHMLEPDALYRTTFLFAGNWLLSLPL